jgi:hypothetical protein
VEVSYQQMKRCFCVCKGLPHILNRVDEHMFKIPLIFVFFNKYFSKRFFSTGEKEKLIFFI